MPTYRILSLDGGGLRGLITARLLQRLDAMPGIAGWLGRADLLVGTSTGGILALGLAAGQSPQAMGDIYSQRGGAIFDDSIWDNLRDLGKTVGADYSAKGLKAELRRVFGDQRLQDLGRKVAIPAFDLDNEASPAERTWKPKIFHNFTGADSDGAQRVADVALSPVRRPRTFRRPTATLTAACLPTTPASWRWCRRFQRATRRTSGRRWTMWFCCRWARA